MGEDSSRVLQGSWLLWLLANLGAEQEGRGTAWGGPGLQKGAVSQGLVLVSSWASSAPGLAKATWPGRKPVQQGVQEPEGGRKPAEWGSHRVLKPKAKIK